VSNYGPSCASDARHPGKAGGWFARQEGNDGDPPGDSIHEREPGHFPQIAPPNVARCCAECFNRAVLPTAWRSPASPSARPIADDAPCFPVSNVRTTICLYLRGPRMDAPLCDPITPVCPARHSSGRDSRRDRLCCSGCLCAALGRRCLFWATSKPGSAPELTSLHCQPPILMNGYYCTK